MTCVLASFAFPAALSFPACSWFCDRVAVFCAIVIRLGILRPSVACRMGTVSRVRVRRVLLGRYNVHGFAGLLDACFYCFL